MKCRVLIDSFQLSPNFCSVVFFVFFVLYCFTNHLPTTFFRLRVFSVPCIHTSLCYWRIVGNVRISGKYVQGNLWCQISFYLNPIFNDHQSKSQLCHLIMKSQKKHTKQFWKTWIYHEHSATQKPEKYQINEFCIVSMICRINSPTK